MEKFGQKDGEDKQGITVEKRLRINGLLIVLKLRGGGQKRFQKQVCTKRFDVNLRVVMKTHFEYLCINFVY